MTQSVVINKGVCKGCLFSLLNNVKCMHKRCNVRMEQENKKRIKITRNKDIKPIFFVDDQVVVAEWENLLQRSGY